MAPNDSSQDLLAALHIDRDDNESREVPQRRLSLLVVVMVAIVVLFAGASKVAWNAVPNFFDRGPEVRIALVEVEGGGSSSASVVAKGYLESRHQVRIGPSVAGIVAEMPIEEGVSVTAGQILAILEHAELDASLEVAKEQLAQAQLEVVEVEAQLRHAKSRLRRAEELAKIKAISHAEHEERETAVELAESRLKARQAGIRLAEAKLREVSERRERLFVRAPFDGTVIAQGAYVGQAIGPSGFLATVADLEHLDVEVDVKEGYINKISRGQRAEVTVDAVPGETYRGVTRTIIPKAERALATIKVLVEILNGDDRLYPDMSCTVRFLPESIDDEEDAEQAPEVRVLCPGSAILRDAEGPFVWVVKSENRVARVLIEPGYSSEGRVEIVSGLQGGERVVVDPPNELSEGQTVRPQ